MEVIVKKIIQQYALMVTALFLVSGLWSGIFAQNLVVSKLALMTFQGGIEIKAAPSSVWAALTEPDKVQQWCPYWKTGKITQPLSMVGQTVTYTDNWGSVGKSVVIFANKNTELRLANVPDDGSYVCQTRYILQAKGPNTLVTVTEQYSDKLDVPTDRDTAVQVKQEIEKYLPILKMVAEKQMAKK